MCAQIIVTPQGSACLYVLVVCVLHNTFALLICCYNALSFVVLKHNPSLAGSGCVNYSSNYTIDTQRKSTS